MANRITALLLTAIVLAALIGACGEDPAPASGTPGKNQGPVQPAGHKKMAAMLRDVAMRTRDQHYYQGSGRLRKLHAQLAELGAAAEWKLYLETGRAELQLGNERAGIEMLTKVHRGLRDGSIAGGRPAIVGVAFYLGVGYMRLGETENCCQRPMAESCILPIRNAALHTKKEGSTKATQYFLEVLANTPDTDYWHLAARWLLNIAYMTLGGYPDEVPADQLIPAAAFESEIEFPKFNNIANALGLDTFNLAGGVIVDDFDGDDYLDIITSTWDTDGQLRFFHNDRDGKFSDRTERAGLNGLLGGLNLVQADYDNDGDADFLVLRGAWLFQDGRHPNSLVRNNGDGTFTDVTFEAGLGRVHYPTQTADWADYDNDGDLDLFIGNESTRAAPAPCQLFRNNGDGSFTDVAKRAGVENHSFTKGVSWGDYDGDRLPDLYVSNNGSANRLYHNKGGGEFVDVAAELGVDGPKDSFPVWFWDYDNDGALDLFVSCYGTGIGHIAAYHLGIPQSHELPRVYRGDGQGKFRDVAQQLKLTYPSMPMGSNFGDLNGDGYLDFYLGTGNVHYHSLMPNLMLLNQGGKSFVDVSMAGGFAHLQKGHGVAFADLDNDGDVDVFEQIGGAFAGDGFRDALFENPGFGMHWISIHAVGTDSNRSAIGTRLRIDIVEGGEVRSIFRHVNSGGSFGANPLRQMIGIGKADQIRRIELFWPVTGKTQSIDGPIDMDRTIRIVEGQSGYTGVELDVLRFQPK